MTDKKGNLLVRLLGAVFYYISDLFSIEYVYPGNTSRIGHLVIEIETYVKMNRINANHVRPIYFIDKKAVANHYMLRLWERDNLIIDLGSWWGARFSGLVNEYAWDFCKNVHGDYSRYWNGRTLYTGDNLVVISDREKNKGREILADLGVPVDAWFVCIHVREANYLPTLKYHSYRDNTFSNYGKAIESIVSLGGYVIRMGDSGMSCPEAKAGLIDYAHSSLRSDFMDIYLCSSCRFFIGDTSGLAGVPFLFEVPIVSVNLIPFYHVQPNTLFITKKLYSRKDQRYLSYAEIVRHGYHKYCYAEEYAAAGLDVIENEPEEIRDVVEEMIDYLDADPDERQSLWYRKMNKQQRNMNGLLSEAGVPCEINARLGHAFCRKYGNELL